MRLAVVVIVVDKVDLVMWAKNGEIFLPRVLRRIEEVIPQESICQRILVDDLSVDRTAAIAKEFNWHVYPNPEHGIPSGANEALRHVERDFFVSVEQDVLLARNWWDKIPAHMNNAKVAVAQGIRLSTEPVLRKLEEYEYNRLRRFIDYPLRFGFSIDNNIYRTRIIKHLGGFPSIAADTLLVKKIVYQTAYRWINDITVVSDHIRYDVKDYYKHLLSYAYNQRRLYSDQSKTPSSFSDGQRALFFQLFRLFLTSPLRASIIAAKTRCFKLLYTYPAIRYQMLKAHMTAHA